MLNGYWKAQKGPPYIGVTGFMNRHEVDAVMSVVPQDITRKIMFGVLISQKSILGMQGKFPHRYPPVIDINMIFNNDFVNDPRVLNFLHFNGHYEDKRENELADDLFGVMLHGGKYCHGIQLNMALPNREHLLQFRYNCWLSKLPVPKIVLQVNTSVLNKYGPIQIAKILKMDYDELVEYVLLDPSGGNGVAFDSDQICDYLDAIEDLKPSFSCGVAGGLSPDNLTDQLPMILTDFPEISIDAEGRLRNEDDDLDIAKAQQYLLNALALTQ